MAYSFVEYTGNGSQTDFVVPFPYLTRDHVNVTVAGATASYTWLNSAMVQITPAPSGTVRIERSSNRSARLTNYQDAQQLTEATLDYDALQLFYLAQEAFDAASVSSVGGGDMLRSNNLADVNSTAAALSNIGALPKAGGTMTGTLVLAGAPTASLHAATKAYVDSVAGGGAAVTSFNSRTGAVSLLSADVTGVLGYTPLNKAGDTMTGLLTLSGAPSSSLHAATKAYVDAVAAAAAVGEANTVSNTGAGAQVSKAKSGLNFPFRTLTAGTNITITQNTDDITIAASGTAGEVNTMSSAGGTQSIVLTKAGVNLPVKGFSAGNGLTLTASGTDLSYAVDQAYNFTWTGKHIHNKASAANDFPVQHTDGSFTAGPITLTTGYSASVDMRKVSTSTYVGGGGNFIQYLQHRLSGSASNNVANGVLRAQLETTQDSSGGTVNDAVVVYGGLYNNGKGVGGFGIHMDTYHAPTGNSADGKVASSYGASIELYRSSALGFTAGFHARSIKDGTYVKANDYAFLASPAGTGPHFKSLFAGGADKTGDVQAYCGLDLRHMELLAKVTSGAQFTEIGQNTTAISLRDGHGIGYYDAGGNYLAQHVYDSASGNFLFKDSAGTPKSHAGLNMSSGALYQWDGTNGAFGDYYVDMGGVASAVLSFRSGARTSGPTVSSTVVTNWMAVRVDGALRWSPLYT